MNVRINTLTRIQIMLRNVINSKTIKCQACIHCVNFTAALYVGSLQVVFNVLLQHGLQVKSFVTLLTPKPVFTGMNREMILILSLTFKGPHTNFTQIPYSLMFMHMFLVMGTLSESSSTRVTVETKLASVYTHVLVESAS